MRFAIPIPQRVGPDGFDAGAFRAQLGRAEELGFDSAWAMEQVLGPARWLSPLEAMTYAAACTERLGLGCAVFVSPLHNPVHLAKAIVSLDHLSRGRVQVGIGTGGRVRPFGAFEVDPSTLVARFNEGLAVMKACWTESPVNFQGRFWQLENALLEPKPLQRPHPPVWIGGNHPNALRRAARVADGFFGAGSQTTEQFAQQVPVVRQELATLGRDPAGFRFAKRVYIHLDDDRARAGELIADALARHYGFPLPPVSVAGPPEECIAGLREVAQAGAELILLNPMLDEAQQIERLAAEVIPQLSD